MKPWKSHSRNPPSIRSGIFIFLTILLLLQVLRSSLYVFDPVDSSQAFRLDASTQSMIDSMKLVARDTGLTKEWTYNANYLNDYRGYRLGLSSRALDSLYAFRETHGRLYSLEAFGKVTGLGGPQLKELRGRLRFPSRQTSLRQGKKTGDVRSNSRAGQNSKVMDLNAATAEDLRQVPGIGPVLSQRILRFREVLGGYLHESQLLDVYGLPPEVARRAMKSFKVIDIPAIQPVNLNSASVEELARLVYLDRRMAEDLVRRRREKGPYTSIDEITEVESIPADKTARIALYLSF